MLCCALSSLKFVTRTQTARLMRGGRVWRAVGVAFVLRSCARVWVVCILSIVVVLFRRKGYTGRNADTAPLPSRLPPSKRNGRFLPQNAPSSCNDSSHKHP